MPRTYALCEDLEVNDAPFYVMEKVDGVIYRDGAALATARPGAGPPALRRARRRARAHPPRWTTRRVGLGEFGHPDGFLERQIRRWGQQWERSKTRELPAVDELARRLNAALPESGPPTIVHGDYRLDNTMMAADDPGKIVAVLDWEMSTLGDPLADLGLFLLYWGNAGAQIIATGSAIDAKAGFLTVRRDRGALRASRAAGRSTRSTGTSCSRPTSSRSSSKASTRGSRWERPWVKASTRWARPSSRSSTARMDQANQSSIPALRG